MRPVSQIFKNIGPGAVVTAAFIGPGTVTVCSLAGIRYGYDLLWALLLSLLATVILQEMAARLGIVTQKGLSENIRLLTPQPLARKAMMWLAFSAIIIGNAAYEAGNINGAAMGLQTLLGYSEVAPFRWFCGLLALTLVLLGKLSLLKKIMLVLVTVMSISFIVAAIGLLPDLKTLLSGLLIPSVPQGGWLTVAGLVGTTIVPYNLFLHATLAKNQWKSTADLKHARLDTRISVGIGGLISLSIVLTAAGSGLTNLIHAVELSQGLQSVYGSWAHWLLGVGLFGAGLTSALTAPLAAGYVATGFMKNSAQKELFIQKAVGILVVVSGLVAGSLSASPIWIITFAQAANGILLPVIILFLWRALNNQSVMQHLKNNHLQNLLLGIIFLIALSLSIKTLVNLF